MFSTHLEKTFKEKTSYQAKVKKKNRGLFGGGDSLLSFDSMQLFNISISKTTRVHYKGYTDTVASVLKNGHMTQGT